MSSIKKVFANKSATDLTAKEGYAVKYDTDGIALASAITDKVIGIITLGGATESEVCIFGECLALCGGAVRASKHLTAHTDGTLIDTASSSTECALALETGVAGVWASVFFQGTNNAVA